MVRMKLLLAGLLVFAFVGCQSAGVDRSSPVEQVAKVESLRALGVIGGVESVVIYPQKIVYEARIDTGATTSSIDARDVVMFERDRSKWVRFFIVDRENDKRYEIERPIVRTSNITRHGQKAEKRPVVELTISMGNVVLVREHGSQILELNARPGLAIQTANGLGLLPRLRLVEDLSEDPLPSPGDRIAFSIENFS